MPDGKCAGRLVVIYDHRAGGWSSSCENFVEVECPEIKCYWYDKTDGDRKQIDVDELLALQAAHDAHADEWAAMLAADAAAGRS